MRLLLRILTLVVIVAVCLSNSSRLQSWLEGTSRLGTGGAREPVTLSHTYLSSDGGWLDFYLSPSSKQMWLLTNANFLKTDATPLAQTQARRPGAIYAMEYQFLNSNNDVLHAGTYHFRAQPPTVQQASHPRKFYTEDHLLPGLGQSMRQRLARLDPRPSRIRLRLGEHDDSVRDVAVRLYCEDELPDYALKHAWQRTSRSNRDRLSRASVYGADLLTNYERRNLLKKKWLAIAPFGVEGRDYERRILYSLTTDETEEPISTELPAGVLVGHGDPAIVPLPDGPGSVRLEFVRATVGPSQQPVEIDLQWFGKRPADRDQWRLQPASDSHVWETELDGGILEIISRDEFTVRAYWQGHATPAGYQEITPARTAVRAYTLGPNSPVEYSIAHVKDQATPLRLAFRQMLPLEPEATASFESCKPARITWSLMGHAGEVIRSGQLNVQEPLSRYDHATAPSGPMRVTDAAVRFFSVPPDVKSLRLESSDTRLVVSASNRPLGVARVTLVPEDYSAFHRQQGWRQSWFLLRPINHLHRANELQTATILTQSRPRTLSEEQAEGEYQWESFQPSGPWTGRHVLLPRQTHLPLRWEALGAAFYELHPGLEYDLTLLGEPGHRSVAPRVVCHTDGTLPVNAQVYVNDQLHQELRLRSRIAELSLDALSARRDATVRLRIETEGRTRVYMNRVSLPSDTVFFKRLVSRIESKTLTFQFEKQSPEEELLGLTLLHAAPRQRARLRVKIIGDVTRAAGPATEWTILERVYDLQPTATVSIPTFAADTETVFEQHQCFVRLGSDLPPRQYTIEVTREDASTGYVLLSRTTPGQSERRSLVTEPAAYSSLETKSEWRELGR